MLVRVLLDTLFPYLLQHIVSLQVIQRYSVILQSCSRPDSCLGLPLKLGLWLTQHGLTQYPEVVVISLLLETSEASRRCWLFGNLVVKRLVLLENGFPLFDGFDREVVQVVDERCGVSFIAWQACFFVDQAINRFEKLTVHF